MHYIMAERIGLLAQLMPMRYLGLRIMLREVARIGRTKSVDGHAMPAPDQVPYVQAPCIRLSLVVVLHLRFPRRWDLVRHRLPPRLRPLRRP